jgi:hypothetical protein
VRRPPETIRLTRMSRLRPGATRIAQRRPSAGATVWWLAWPSVLATAALVISILSLIVAGTARYEAHLRPFRPAMRAGGRVRLVQWPAHIGGNARTPHAAQEYRHGTTPALDSKGRRPRSGTNPGERRPRTRHAARRTPTRRDERRQRLTPARRRANDEATAPGPDGTSC